MLIHICAKQQVNRLASVLLSAANDKQISELQNELHLSRRSVFYLLKQLNETLCAMALDPVRHFSHSGYFLTQQAKEALRRYRETDDFGQLTGDERRNAIVWLLVQHTPKLSLAHLVHLFHVSKNTMISDLKKLRAELPSHLQVKNTSEGKVLVGDEEQQRKWVYMQIVKRKPFIIHSISKLPKRTQVDDALISLQRQSQNHYSDDASKTLIDYVVFLFDRIDRLGPIATTGENAQQIANHDIIGNWCRLLLQRYAKATPGEVAHLRRILLAAQLQGSSDRSPIMKQILILSKQIVSRFYTISGVDLLSDKLIRSLAVHLLPTYYRVKYRVPYHLSNLSVLRSDYAHLLQLTRYAVQPFEQFIGESLPDDEIGLITVYFGGELRKRPKSFKALHADVYLVCTSGIGTTEFLLQQLSVRFPDIAFSKPMNIKEFHQLLLQHKMPKMVITTTNLESSFPIPIIRVHAVLSQYDLRQLDKEFGKIGLLQVHNQNVPSIVRDVLDIVFDYARIEDFHGLTDQLTNYFASRQSNDDSPDHPTYCSISELLPISHIQVVENMPDWKTAVRESFAPLTREQTVGANYIQKIIDLTEAKGTYMIIKELVMLAHAAPQDGVKKLSMSMLLLRHPVIIGPIKQQKAVKLVIALAPTNRVSHVKALGQLLNLLNSDGLFHQLIQAESANDIQCILNKLDDQAL
ncbi:MAG: PTS sugar transporter subunit IIA [Sporolactobacillus sp.]|jgi:transcriptional antiterminator/mannitol/fructose-specific phosphotransferase system IIA component (Ntr-type)|nr:PTS sugar transporter subunit IIA [Sporolactobacillus sp.]